MSGAYPDAIPRTPELEDALLTLLRSGVPLSHAAPRLFVSSAWVYKQARADAGFAIRLKEARPATLVYEQRKRRLTTDEKARKRKGWCADKTCGVCRSCRAVTVAATRRRPVTRAPHPRAWSEQEDALLRRLAGRRTTREIVEALGTEAWGPSRSANAVAERASCLDLSLMRSGERMTLTEVEAFFGTWEGCVYRLIATGDLPAVRSRETRGGTWFVERAAVERFLREKPWAYNPARLGPGRLGDLGRLICRADPWLTLGEAMPWLGYRSRSGVLKALTREGCSFERRLLGSKGQPSVVLRRRDLPAIARALEAGRERQLASALRNVRRHHARGRSRGEEGQQSA